jgi:autotransporter-associated beta strand protein
VEWLEDRLAPAQFVWTGGDGSSPNWSVGSNWQGGKAPTVAASLVFDSLGSAHLTSNNDLTGNDLTGLQVASIAISGGNYNLTGNSITLGDPLVSDSGTITVASSVRSASIEFDMTLNGPSTSDQFVTVNSGARLTITGHLSGKDSLTLKKEGTGTLTLANDNSDLAGPIMIDNNAGIVAITDAHALGDGITTVGTNAQLQVENVATPIATGLILNGPGVANKGALLNVSGSNSWAGDIVLDSNATLGASAGSSLNITGQISDLGTGFGVTKEGPGSIIFSHMGGNTYRGLTTINDGILTIEDRRSLGSAIGQADETVVNYNTTSGKAGTLQVYDPNSATDSGGFPVTSEQLVLNGPGFGGIGALDNLGGDNTWAGAITLGSPSPNGSPVSIGVDSSALTLSGGVDGALQPVLTKLGPGTLIFPATAPADTQTDTIISAGDVQVDGTIAKVQLNGGSVSGKGKVGAITCNNPTTGSAGTIDPGDNFPAEGTGSLSSSVVSLNAATQVFVDLVDLADGPSDLLSIPSGSSIDLGGASLAGTAPTVGSGESIKVIAAGSVTGHFAGPATKPVAGGDSATAALLNGLEFVVDYFPDHVMLTRVPTPTLALSGPAAFTPGKPYVLTLSYVDDLAITSTTINWGDGTVDVLGGQPLTAEHTYALTNVTSVISATARDAFVAFPAQNTLTVTASTTLFGTPTATSDVTLDPTSPAVPIFGQPIILHAVVTAAPGPGLKGGTAGASAPGPITTIPGTLAGTVDFFDNGTTLIGTAQLDSNGLATLPIADLGVGAHAITATYVGGVGYAPSSSADPFLLDVARCVTDTQFVASTGGAAIIALSGQFVGYTVHVVRQDGAIATGTIQFTVNINGQIQNQGPPVPLSAGIASTQFVELTPGNYDVTATYTPDDTTNVDGSFNHLSEEVNPWSVQSIQQAIGQAQQNGSSINVLQPASQFPVDASMLSSVTGLSQPISFTVMLTGGISGPVSLSTPPNMFLSIKTAPNSPGAVIEGDARKSPMTIDSGATTLENLTLVGVNKDPTLDVHGGTVRVRNVTIKATQPSAVGIQVSGTGYVDAGTKIDPGHNTIAIRRGGKFIRNATPRPVSALGNTFIIGERGSSPISIEKHIRGAAVFGAVATASVLSVQVNDGSPQRSMVTSLLVSLTSGDVGTFALADASGKPLRNIQIIVDAGSGGTVMLTFKGPGTEFGSLPDGHYTLLYDGAPVAVPNFFRLFGDSNGDGVVDSADLAAFQAALHSQKGQTNYVPFFDFDQNGTINDLDYYEFLRRYTSA